MTVCREPFTSVGAAENNRCMGKQHGFTLIELLTTVGLAAVLLSFAVPSMSQFLAKRSLESAASALATDYRFARSEAIKRTAVVTICRSNDGASCAGDAGSWHVGWIVFVDSDNNGAVDAGEDILRVQQALGGIQSMSNVVEANTVHTARFRPNGIALPVNDGLVITPSVAAATTRLLCISNQGRVSIRAQGVTAC